MATGGGHIPPNGGSRHGEHPHFQTSPSRQRTVVPPSSNSGPPTEVATSVMSSWTGNGNGVGRSEVNYATSAVEILDLLREGVAILSGGRDKQGQSIITIPAQQKNYVYQRDPLRRVVQYLACIPAADVRDLGFSVILDARNTTWANTKVVLRTLQEALPGQIHIAYIIQPGQFWQKQQSSRGHSKEKGKLEFSTIKLSAVEKLTRHVDSSQLTNDVGGFLPYRHDQWLSLRQDLEHFISLHNGLMEHSTHIEQQIHMEQDNTEADSYEEQLKRHLPLQDMVKRAPQDAIRKGNDLLRNLERGREESGTAMTPDKINAVAVIKQMLEHIAQRQGQLEGLWNQRKATLEQNLQVKSFERSVYKVRGWLKTRGEDMVVTQCDVGVSVESVQSILEHHEKCEAKARLQYNLLTQLRRSADRYAGEQHFAAENMQKQVSKLSAKFTLFESKMAARRSIIDSSLQLHTSLRQWKEQCKVVAQVLKQEGAGPGSEGAKSQQQLVEQLQQIGGVVLEEAESLMELMLVAMRQPDVGGDEGGRGNTPDYTTGIGHVKRLIEEVENHRRRLGQLAEVRKVQGEQLKQIDSCEKDAVQETRWLQYLLTQLSNTYGDIGDSMAAVDKLITEHNKFVETAKKSYKYGCGLLSAAGKGRKSFQLEGESSSSLLASHTSTWEQLSSGTTEVGERLKMARHFHSLSEEVVGNFAEWLMPLHELPKTADLVKGKLRDIADHSEELFLKMNECLATGRSLLDRLERPLLPEPDFLSLNEHVRNSQAYLTTRVAELDKKEAEVKETLPKQQQLLHEFVIYCQFERRIEEVLLWLQKTGLKKLPSFSQIGANRPSLQEQLLVFEEFRMETVSLGSQVQELHDSAEQVEAEIKGFHSDIGKKTFSLKTVWDKFIQRVENRGVVLHMALTFHTDIQQVALLGANLESALSPEAVAGGGGAAYLDDLVHTKNKFDELCRICVQDGGKLMEIFSQPPVDPLNPVDTISQHLITVEHSKKKVDEMWKKVWSTQDGHVTSSDKAEDTKSKASTEPVGMTVAQVHTSPGKVRRVNQVGVVSKKNSDKFSELEEEAYECLEWLEAEYAAFISAHCQFHENPEQAILLKNKYSKFLTKLDPTCQKVERVLDLMSQLRSEAPPLIPSIDKLCHVVSDRVKMLKSILTQCSNVLDTFSQFCNLYKEVDGGFQKLEVLLGDEELSGGLSVDVVQDLLEQGTVLMTTLQQQYSQAQSTGESFLNTTSEILCNRGGPKLAVGGACTSVAVDLGDLEGRGPELFDRWADREKVLMEMVSCHAFKQSSEQICSWLRESAELFLQNHTDIGTSLETAEDLLTEHQEFQARAEHYTAEVSTLQAKSEVIQRSSHPHTQHVRELTNQLKSLHGNFEARFANRKKLLQSTMEFYHGAKEVGVDMSDAIERCGQITGPDLPSHLKITSISSRLTNLQHHGNQLILSLANKPTPSKAKRRSRLVSRSNSASGSEVAIREQLASLQMQFSKYKKVFESRHLSPVYQPTTGSQKPVSPVSPVLLETRAHLRSPVQENGGSSVQRLSVEGEGPKTPKTASLGRSSTVGGWWRRDSPKAVIGGKVVKEQVAVLNEKSKEDVVPIQELGTSYGGPRKRAKSAGSATLRSIMRAGEERSEVEGVQESNKRSEVKRIPAKSESVDDVPLRRKGRGLSKAERCRKIEDIKKLFETSELSDQLDDADSAPVWSPREYVTKETISAVDEEVAKVTTSVGPAMEEVTSDKEAGRVISPAVIVSPPPETRQRLNTAPTVIRTVIKDHTPPAKKQVITISLDSTAESANEVEGSSLDPKVIAPFQRSTRSSSPQHLHRVNTSPTSPRLSGRRGLFKGKVSSLRDMFDPQAKGRGISADGITIMKPIADSATPSKSQSAPVANGDVEPAPPSTSSEACVGVGKVDVPDTVCVKVTAHDDVRQDPPADVSKCPSVRQDPPVDVLDTPSCPIIDTVQDPVVEIGASHMKELSPPRPQLPIMTPSPCHSPPPLPPTPQGYYDHSRAHTPNSPLDYESDSGSAGSSCSSLLDEEDIEYLEDQVLEWEEEGEDEGDMTDSALRAFRPLKSLRVVISDLLTSELDYLKSLEVLEEVYRPHLQTTDHTPSFLQGAEAKIFANLSNLYAFERKFSEELSQHDDSLEGICNSFMANEDGFQCYLPFLLNLDQSLQIVTEYGGSFFTDKQRQVGDEGGVATHLSRPRQRLVEYMSMFRDLSYCAQKQYLHGVTMVKDASKVMIRVLRAVDNAYAMSHLRGCPHDMSGGHMICRDHFLVYTTRTKKKVQEMCVFLHSDRVVFSRPRKDKGKGHSGKAYLEFREAIETNEMHLLETYKTQQDKFALCGGRLAPDNLIILQPTYQSELIKRVWLQEIWPVLQKREVSRDVLVTEDEMPLPLFFRSYDTPTPTASTLERAAPKRSHSISRGLSFRRRKKEVGSASTQGSVSSGVESERREAMIRSSYISTASSTTSSIPAAPLASIHLASLSSVGEFIPEKPVGEEEVYEVIEDVSGDDFMTVSVGQLLEILDDSNKEAWLVLTLPPGEGQEEGFVPPQCLRRVKTSSCVPPLSEDTISAVLNEQFEAETGQEMPQGSAGEEEEVDAMPTAEQPLTPEEKQEETTGQSLTSPVDPDLTPSNTPSHTPSQTSLTDDVTGSVPRPPHQDLLGAGSSGQLDSSSDVSSGASLEPLPSFPPAPPVPDKRLHLKGPLSCSLHSLPSSFSPAGTPVIPPHSFLGYNPLMIPTLTMSQPNIPEIKMEAPAPPQRQKGELSQLQWATVKATPETSLEDFDPVEVHIAIADFVAVEESNISLRAGQCVQVLDNSRSDWWLVLSGENEAQGWVPANYLEQRILEGPISPPPDPFEDEMGELANILRKGQSPSEINLRRRELYTAPFLAPEGESPPEPSEAQLQGVFSIHVPYLAVTEVQGEYAEQLSVIRDQPVHVLDSMRGDWWLVSTIPEGEGEEEEEATPPTEGWVRADLLQQDTDIRENSVENAVGGAEGVGPVAKHSLSRHSTVSPSGHAQWVVLADYAATEPGMLSVNEGEMVELIETSSNDWCLVRPNSRPGVDGWVPMAYLCPYGSNGFNHAPSPLNHSLSTSSEEDESDTPTEMYEHGFVPTPEPLETCKSEEQRADSEERRKYVLSELSQTEQDYVQKLNFCLMNYDPEAKADSAPRALRSLRNTLLGNLEEIYLFHKEKLLPKLLECESDPTHLGDAFVLSEEELRLYISYCQNKASSDDIYHEFFSYFEELRIELKDRQKLPDYLILPVQRITKYGLLLSDFHKYSVKSGLPAGNIDQGLEVTRNISTQANNAIHLSLIEERSRNNKFGELVLQELFLSQESHRQVYKERRVFLFQRALLITKKRRREESEAYAVKDQLMLHDVSMIQDMDKERRNLIVYDMVTGTKFILRASKPTIRDQWLEKSNLLIQKAKQDVSMEMALRVRSASEPAEFAHSFSLSRKSVFRRDGERKNKRSKSSIGVSSAPPTSDEMIPVGMKYVVMERIVMEGEDDHTLEPGDVVQLARAMPEGTPLLLIRTIDEHPLEGKVASSYLRRKDSIKGRNMESTPKFTMHPVDLDLLVGSMATITCAFNGCPAPSVVWKRDHEVLVSDERRRVMSCSTSSVLELHKLEYDDEGRYTCHVTNAIGDDSTTMTLSLHGPPSEPQKPTVSKVTSTSVKLKWSLPDMDGGVAILSYQVEMLQDGFDQWQPIVQQPRPYFVVKTLEPSTTYQFRVSAVNKYGFSDPSEPSDLVVTRGKGLLNTSPSFRKHSSNIDKDELVSLEDARDPFIRRGSVSSAYDLLPEELGRGRFGIVHPCNHRISGMQYAAKFVRLRSRKKAWVRKEAEILQKIRGKSPYLLEFQDAFERGRNLIIITELVPSGEILEVVVAENNLTEAIAVRYLSELLSAVDTLHKLKVAHLDIRPENILLAFGRVKVIDFGTARDLAHSDPAPLFASSVEFCAPEVVNQDVPTLAADMWSIGVLTYVLLSGLSPFFAENIHSVVEKIKDARYSFYSDQFDSISQEAKEFISALLQRSPEYRMSAPDALQHSWVRMLGGVGERVASPWLMAKLDISQLKSFITRRKWHTSTVAVDDSTVYGPRSMICFSPTPPDFEELAKNEDPPCLFGGPDDVTGQKGSSVTLQFQVSGSPIPSVTWEHQGHGEVKMSSRQRVVELSGGVTSLTISNVRCEDGGVYSCSAVNHLGSVTASCKLTILVVPGAPSDVNTIILGSYNSALISWLPPVVDGNSPISKYILERRKLDFDLWEVVSHDIEGAAHVVDDLLPDVTYVFRVSASNAVGTGPTSNPSEPITIEDYDSDSPTLGLVQLKTTPFSLEYQLGEEIAKGNFCAVFKCTEKTTDYVYVAKVLSVEGGRPDPMGELEMLRDLVHPRVMTLEDAYRNEDQLILLLEYMAGGTLAEYVCSHVLTDYTSVRLMRKLMEGVQYLHDSSVIHANLNPSNILLSSGFGELKISGFGTARYLQTGNQLTDLTSCEVEFLAPEAVGLQPLTTGADIWSVGGVAAFMLTGKSPFLRDTKDATLSAVTSCSIDLTHKDFANLSEKSLNYVETCLNRNPRRRPSAQQCQRHHWLMENGGVKKTPNTSPSRRGSEGQGSPSKCVGPVGSPLSRRKSSSGSEKGKSSNSSPSLKSSIR